MIPSLLFLALLWLQFCFVLAPSWAGGTYYDYGWLAPPVIAFLAYLRWQDRPSSHSEPSHSKWLPALIFLGVLIIIPIRIIQHVDIYWRLLLWVHACILLIITHLTLSLVKGWQKSLLLLPATILILVAVPLPSAIQNGLVQTLTHWVLDLAASILPAMGYPAIIAGSAFIVNGHFLDVAEGCSGIRSFQSCIMAALVLGEIYRFGVFQRLSLLALALVTAVITNTIRIIALTRLTYTKGHTAMNESHDAIGIATTVVTYLLIAVLAWLIGKIWQKERSISRKIEHHS